MRQTHQSFVQADIKVADWDGRLFMTGSDLGEDPGASSEEIRACGRASGSTHHFADEGARGSSKNALTSHAIQYPSPAALPTKTRPDSTAGVVIRS